MEWPSGYGFKWTVTDSGNIWTGRATATQFLTRYFDEDGTAIGDWQAVHTGGSNYSVRDVESDGSFILEFDMPGNSGDPGSVVHKAMLFDGTGAVLAQDAAYLLGDHSAVLAGGNRAVVTREWAGGIDYVATAKIYDSDGALVGEHSFGPGTSNFVSDIVTYETGAWSFLVDSTATFFEADGTLLHQITLEFGEKLVFDGDGSYQLTSFTSDYTTHQAVVTQSSFDRDGVLVDAVEYPTFDFVDYFWGAEIHDLGNGLRLVSWAYMDNDQGTTNFARILDSNGAAIGADIASKLTYPYEPAKIIDLEGGGYVLSFGDQGWILNADGTQRGGPFDFKWAAMDATDDGGWRSLYAEWGSDYSTLKLRTFHPNDVNSAPVAIDLALLGVEDTASAVNPYWMNFYDPDGDELAAIVIEDLPVTGELRVNGVLAIEGLVVDKADFGNITWKPAANAFGSQLDFFHFNVIDDHGNKSIQPAKFHLSASAVDDAAIGGDVTLTAREDERLYLTADMFPFADIDSTTLSGIDIVKVSDPGGFVHNWGGLFPDSLFFLDGSDPYYISAPDGAGSGYAQYQFRYNTGSTPSAWYNLTINVEQVNDAPVGSGGRIFVEVGENNRIIDNIIGFKDLEGDSFTSIVIDKLPRLGVLSIDGHRLAVGDEVAAEDISRITYHIDKDVSRRADLGFSFRVRDDGGTVNGGLDLSAEADRVQFDFVASAIHGTIEDDILKGSKGRDYIWGGAGDDRIFGGARNDMLRGGSGSDVFVLKKGGDSDRITDFDSDVDRIDLTQTSIHGLKSLLKNAGVDASGKIHIWVPTKDFYDLDELVLDADTPLTVNNFIFAHWH
jgi:hypothetical protein